MSKEHESNFLRVQNGRPYFARVSVATDLAVQGVHISRGAGSHDSHLPQSWLEAASVGGAKALNKHLENGGTKIGVVINRVLGTEVDTTNDSVQAAACIAAWVALGHQESDLSLLFENKWLIEFSG